MGNCINMPILIRNKEFYNNYDSHINIQGDIVFLNCITNEMFNAATIVYTKTLTDDIKENKHNCFMQKIVKKINYNKLSSYLKTLIDNSYEIMTLNGFNCNKNKIFIKFQKYNLPKYTNNSSIFTRNCNNKTAHNFNTMIIYLYKDKRLTGGDFLYYHNDKYHKIIIENNTIIMLNGVLKYTSSNLNGIGQVKSIVIQFEKI